MSTMSSTTANWHWKNKNCTRWGKEWFERELVTLVVEEADPVRVAITKVTDVDGDIELGQRKSKLITIFDCKVSLDWAGVASDGTEVKGRLVIPEVSHEVTVDRLSDYVFEWSCTTAPSGPVNELFQLAKTRLPAAIEAKLSEFPIQMVETHGKDITVSTDPSRVSTPVPTSSTRSATSATPASVAKAAAAPTKRDVKPINLATVGTEATFMATADDLFDLLTDEKRIPSWSRAPAKSTPEAGSEFSLFGGGVVGKYKSLSKPKEIVQDWTLKSPTWPEGHAGTLTISLDQSSDSTTVRFNLEGVPKGMEDEIRRNIEGYYIHGLKSIGLGSVL